MWIPQSEREIAEALRDGAVCETATFDAKQALPPPGKNKDLAKDICAMTADGGVLLYGIGGDDPTRPDRLFPLDLAGAAERIDQVAQTSLSEPPAIEIRDVPSDGESGTGYLAVIVPASPRAPHMLTVGNDGRYWGRGATGNRVLTEGEVARLYARRERWDIDRDAWLADVIASSPFRLDDPPEHDGRMVVAVRPVSGDDVLRRAAGELEIGHFALRLLREAGNANDPYPDQGTRGIETVGPATRRGSERWVLRNESDGAALYQAHVELSSGGTLLYWHCPTIRLGTQSDHQQPVLLEQSVTRAVHQALGSASALYEQSKYVGAVDIGVGVLGLDNAIGASQTQAFGPTQYGAPDYRFSARVTTLDLRSIAATTNALLRRLFETVSMHGYDPYAESVIG